MAEPTLVVVTGPPGTGKSTLAEAVSARLGGAAVLGWDWAMAGMRWCTPIQDALATLDHPTYARVGWSILANLAEAQLRAGRSVVLDGLARDRDLDALRAMVEGATARLLVVALGCSDLAVLRSRIEGRQRHITGWHELTWTGVQRTLSLWVPPFDVDLVVDTAGGPDPHAVAARLLPLYKSTERP
jgi:predicted kinase